MKRSSFAAGAFGAAFRSGRGRWRQRLRRVLQRGGADDWCVLLQTHDRKLALIERGLFCLALAFIAKYPPHIAIFLSGFFSSSRRATSAAPPSSSASQWEIDAEEPKRSKGCRVQSVAGGEMRVP